MSLRLQVAQSRYYLQTLDPKVGAICIRGALGESLRPLHVQGLWNLSKPAVRQRALFLSGYPALCAAIWLTRGETREMGVVLK